LKSKNFIFHIKILVLITLLIVLVIHKAAAEEEPIKIAVTPFTLNAPEDMQYLRSGIQDMLESRLSQDEKVIVVNDEKTAQAMEGIVEPIDENEARDIGKQVGADVVLIGSLTVFGSSASLDARLVDVTGENETTAFFDQSQSMDELVPKINTLAEDVNAAMTGAAASVTAAPAPASQLPVSDAQAHPEKLTDTPIQAETDAAAPVEAYGGVLSAAFWKSRTYKINIHGLALGDVDGDQRIETVVITGNHLYIFRSEANKFYKIYELKKPANRNFIGVDIADINANGIPEIFISGLSPQKTGVSSMVLEFDGKAYQTIVKNSRQLFRVIHMDSQAPMLFGQNFTPKTGRTKPIYHLQWSGNTYKPGDNVIAKSSINLMGFGYGDAFNSGSYSVLASNYSDRLELFDENGTHEWTSSDHIGGSTLNYSKGIIGRGEEEFEYLPMRVLMKDLDHDGKQEAIVIKNYELARRALKEFRVFSDFHIASLSWDGLGMRPKWQTPKTSGYMRDYAIGDFDNDGQDELVGAVVMREDRIIGVHPKSSIIAYEIVTQENRGQ